MNNSEKYAVQATKDFVVVILHQLRKTIAVLKTIPRV